MKRLFVISTMLLFGVTVAAQRNVVTKVSSKVVVQDGTILLKAVKDDLNSKNIEAQKLIAELQTMISNMPYEIRINDKNKEEEFLTLFENFDQKANQLFNLLSTIIKTAKEAESSVVHNIN
jgi:uncharacterized protein YukE